MILRRCCVQALLTILDSQLNKSGMVQAVYVKTEKGVLFEVKPYTRLPRTFKHFCGLMCKFNSSHLNIKKHADIVSMSVFVFWLGALFDVFTSFLLILLPAVQLLQKLSITAVGKREKLLRAVKNPVSQYLPVNSRKIGEVNVV